MTTEYRTWAEIDLSAIRHNLGAVRERIGPAAGILAVVKANAYGHGMRKVAEALAKDVAFFGVANLEEACGLEGLERDVLLLSPSLPSERREVVARGFIPTVSSAAEAREFAGGRVNFKIDTGMGRIGCWQDQALKDLATIANTPEVVLHSISTHLPSADEDIDFTVGQLENFAALSIELRRLAPGARIHALNSAGILEFPGHAHDLVRPGLMLYGSAYPSHHQDLLRPALTWKARVLLVRDLGPGRSVSYGRTFVTQRPSRVASLAVGYADGFPRQASNQSAHVLIGGRRCPVLGRVTMDQILVDVTEVEGAHPGAEAVLIGRQGMEEIQARELADQAGTISWHIFTGLGPRVKRVYL
jgi:alanine racemase